MEDIFTVPNANGFIVFPTLILARVVTEPQAERSAKDFEAHRIVEKERMLAELRSQRENDDKHRQQFNAMRSADTRNKSYVVDDRLVPPPPTNNYATNDEMTRRS